MQQNCVAARKATNAETAEYATVAITLENLTPSLSVITVKTTPTVSRARLLKMKSRNAFNNQ